MTHRTVWLAILCLAAVTVQFQTSAISAQAANLQSTGYLESYWPVDIGPRQWQVVRRGQSSDGSPRTTMTLRNQPIGALSFILWFSRPGQPKFAENGEQYHVCLSHRGSWLYFDQYIDLEPNIPTKHHLVRADKIIYTPDGEGPIDMIGNGQYSDCGASGQPYLRWDGPKRAYKLQVWGHLANNPNLKWYWEASVKPDDSVLNDCVQPPRSFPAVRVQEAWWSNFKGPARTGRWTIGKGDVIPGEGIPSGQGVTYGRTVWHGSNKLPYMAIGTKDGRPNQCARW